MKLEELKTFIKDGKVGLIPGWLGYIKYDYNLNQIYFINNGYIINQLELEDNLKNRNDLYYII